MNTNNTNNTAFLQQSLSDMRKHVEEIKTRMGFSPFSEIEILLAQSAPEEGLVRRDLARKLLKLETSLNNLIPDLVGDMLFLAKVLSLELNTKVYELEGRF